MRNSSILAALGFSLLLGLSPLAADPVIRRGIDVFTTPADGRTYYDFAQSPIPAGFFCQKSKAFTGRVAFKGLPLVTGVLGRLGAADTVFERLDDAVFDAEGVAVTRLKVRALSLVSISPLKTACGAFYAYVTLGGPQRVTEMTLQRTQEGGGSFSAPLAIDARLTFIPVRPARGKSARKLELTGSFTFPANPIAWSFTGDARTKGIGPVLVDTDGDLAPETRLPGASNFLPGIPPEHRALSKVTGSCCSERVCHTDSGKLHCTFIIPPGCTQAVRCAP